jgi:hypothetical protein
MSNYERRIQFEAFIAMRERYAAMGDDDRCMEISIAEVIHWAEVILEAAINSETSAAD